MNNGCRIFKPGDCEIIASYRFWISRYSLYWIQVARFLSDRFFLDKNIRLRIIVTPSTTFLVWSRWLAEEYDEIYQMIYARFCVQINVISLQTYNFETSSLICDIKSGLLRLIQFKISFISSILVWKYSSSFPLHITETINILDFVKTLDKYPTLVTITINGHNNFANGIWIFEFWKFLSVNSW